MPGSASFRNARHSGAARDYRPAAERDCDRILYCSAFRRLGEVTQVVAVSEVQLFHNRLTHSLKVAQIGKRLAQFLLKRTDADLVKEVGGLDPTVVEAAALAHDLGHPPFGHVAEAKLQELLAGDFRLPDSFEGNAQTFRIVTKLSWRSFDEKEPALDLTRASLNAILKYPWLRGDQPHEDFKDKWGSYLPDRAIFEFAREGAKEKQPSIEAQIMDLADDIAYAVHDVEDFFRAGLVPLDRLAADSKEQEDFAQSAIAHLEGKVYNPVTLETYDRELCEDAFENLHTKLLPRSAYTGTRFDRTALHDFASGLITRFFEHVEIQASGALSVERTRRHEIAMLKRLTWHYVIDNPALASLQRGQGLVISELMHALHDWTDLATRRKSEEGRLPTRLRELIKAIRSDEAARTNYGGELKALRTRAIVDYVSSLTEDQALELHQRLTGSSGRSVLESWLRT